MALINRRGLTLDGAATKRRKRKKVLACSAPEAEKGNTGTGPAKPRIMAVFSPSVLLPFAAKKKSNYRPGRQDFRKHTTLEQRKDREDLDFVGLGGWFQLSFNPVRTICQ